MKTTELFNGVAVIIDDEISDANANVQKLISQIKKNNYPLLTFDNIPEQEVLNHLGQISFLVLDWELSNPLGTDAQISGARLPHGVQQAKIKENIEFIKEINSKYFMPVFVFTNASITDVKNALQAEGISTDPETGTVFVKSKSEVSKRLLTTIKKWLQKSPSMYSLKMWDVAYRDAKMKLFKDLYALNPKWPKVMWNNFKDDGVPPSNELGKLLNANLLSRMQPFEFEKKILDGKRMAVKKEDLIKVLESERYLPNDKLNAGLAAPGDIFKVDGDFFVNIKAECDCISREGEELELYCLKGQKITKPKEIYVKKYGKFDENETEFIVYPILDGKAYKFSFKKLYIKKWSEISNKRRGRIIPPFSTKLQQKYSSYLQRQGLPRIPAKSL